MKKLITTLLAVAAMLALAGTAFAATGDINVTVADMDGMFVAGSAGGQAKLWGVTTAGVWVTVGTKTANESGIVTWTAADIAAATTGIFTFNINTYASSGGAMTKLKQNGGFWGQFITYSASDDERNWKVRTPTGGGPQPVVTWNGASSKITFGLNLGDITDAAFTFDCMDINKANPSTPAAPQNVGANYGSAPTMLKSYLTDKGYTVTESGQVGTLLNLQLTKTGYDQTFLAYKSGSDATTTYSIYLTGMTDLDGSRTNGTYDKNAHTYSLTFDPATIFSPEPANSFNTGIFSDGPGMVVGHPYYATTYLEIAGSNYSGDGIGGLTLNVNPGTADTIFYPINLPEPATMGLLALGGLGALIRRRRRAAR
jgi:hypothetical protein